MRILSQTEIEAMKEGLEAGGVKLLLTSIVDSAGVIRGKQVPVARLKSVHLAGLGASSTWGVFCIDNEVAWTPDFTAIGDERLRADLSALVELEGGLAWAPADVFGQDGEPTAWCSRAFLRQQQGRLEALGLDMLAGGELEFSLIPAEGPLRDDWQSYGVGPELDVQGFLFDVEAAFGNAGLGLEQLHAEYGAHQYELSLSPALPLQAADKLALAKILLGRAARRHGLLVSFSPVPFANGVGNGAHLHFSFTRDGQPLFSGHEGPHGISREGGAIIAGVVSGLPELVGLLAPSLLSPMRLQPGHWSGAYACWGMENREAAVRFCAATSGNPHGANMEVKCIDGSANPYIAAGAVLTMALDGLARDMSLPDEVGNDPVKMSHEERAALGIRQLPPTQGEMLEALENSSLARGALGDMLLDALVAVRRHEMRTYGNTSLEDVTRKFRFAWSV